MKTVPLPASSVRVCRREELPASRIKLSGFASAGQEVELSLVLPREDDADGEPFFVIDSWRTADPEVHTVAYLTRSQVAGLRGALIGPDGELLTDQTIRLLPPSEGLN